MKYEFRIDQDKVSKIVLMPEDEMEKQILMRIFEKENIKVEVVTNKDQFVISSKKKDDK